MRCVGGRWVGEAKEIHCAGMKKRTRQYQERMVHTRSSAEENKNRYNSMRNKAGRIISKAMRGKSDESFTVLRSYPI